MEIELHYGRRKIDLIVPKENLLDIIRPVCQKKQNICIKHLFQTPTGNRFQNAVIGKRIAILLPDATRSLPVESCIDALLPQTQLVSHIRFMICTGTHTADTAGNRLLCQQITDACRRHNLQNYDIVIHDCKKTDFATAGKTSRGTQVQYNTAIDDAQVFVVISDIKPHYFAGYSNPVKNFVPGLCDYQTARGNHSLAMDEKSRFCAHPWHLDPNRQQQPLAEDQLEAANLLIKGRPVWALATVSSDKKIQWADFGPAQETTANAFQIVDLWNFAEVCPASRTVISPGGHPNDIDLYICQRALELCAAAFADGGEVLFAAACGEGIGPAASMEHFWDILTLPLDQIDSAVQGEYKLFSHKPLRFSRLIRRLRRLWVYSELQDQQVLAGHCQPTHDPQDIIDGWIRENPAVKIRFIDEANALALTNLPVLPSRTVAR